MDIKKFQIACMNEKNEIIVQKFLMDGSVYFFSRFFTNTDEEFNFKKDIAVSLNVHIKDVVIVGSGKLGFSIKPDKSDGRYYAYKKFDFDKKSDLDVAIVSSSLFDSQLLSLYDHTESYTIKTYSHADKKSFAFYILKGWLRPDYLPKQYLITPQVDEIQQKYKTKYERDINIGIYKSWHFFETYHKNNIQAIQLNLIATS